MAVSPSPLTIRGREFLWGSRTYVMGVLNITLDSFSGDGLGYDVDAAVAQGRRFAEEGADILDVGGESTRPGFDAVTAGRGDRTGRARHRAPAHGRRPPYQYRYLPRRPWPRLPSRRAPTSLNDVWGLRHDPEMAAVAARFAVPAVMMHNQRGRPSTT